MPWRRERLPTPVFWPGEFRGLYSPWDRRVRHDWVTFTYILFLKRCKSFVYIYVYIGEVDIRRRLIIFLKVNFWHQDFTFTFHFYALEKETATHSSVLAWRIPGTGSHRVGHDWSDLAVAVVWHQNKRKVKAKWLIICRKTQIECYWNLGNLYADQADQMPSSGG